MTTQYAKLDAELERRLAAGDDIEEIMKWFEEGLEKLPNIFERINAQCRAVGMIDVLTYFKKKELVEIQKRVAEANTIVKMLGDV